MTTLKVEIQKLSAQQAGLKLQRKTVHFEGVRTLSPGEAWAKHRHNRMVLRDMYIVQGLLKGKKYEEIEPTTKDPLSPKYIERILEKYGQETLRNN